MKATNAALTALLNGQRKGLRFTGVGDYISVPYAASLDLTLAFTIECVINVDTTDPSQGFIDKTVGGLTNTQFWLGAEAGVFRCRVKKGSTFNADSTAGAFTISNRVNTHLAATYDGALVQMYVNGLPSGSALAVAAPLDSGNGILLLGMLGAATGFGCAGTQDESRIYNRACSAAEMAEHAKGIFRDETGLVGYWPMDEGSGTVVYDLSGNGNNGSFVGSPSPAYVDFNPYPGREQQYLMADLYTFTLVGGSVLRYAGYDIPVKSGGNTFTVLPIKRGAIREQAGINVDSLKLTVFADATHLVNTVAFLKAAATGALDGATVKVERAFMPIPGIASAGTITRFVGNVSECIVSRTQAQITVKSALELLNVQMPRNVYQPSCVHSVYDTGCALLKSSFVAAGTVSAGATTTVIPCSLAQAAGYFDLGTITFTSGANAGSTRSVKSYTPGSVTLARPLVAVPANGDAFNAYPGCDRKQATCSGKFSNIIHFRGEPYIPIPETAL